MLPCFDRLASSFHTTRIERWQYAHMGRNDCMTLDEAIQEFEFDCKIRHLSPKTIDNYKKQLRYLGSLLCPFNMLSILIIS